MENKTIAVELQFSMKEIRQAHVFLTGEMITDEEIEKLYINRQAVKVNTSAFFGSKESLSFALVYMSFLVEESSPYKKTENPKKSKFEEKIEAMEQAKRNEIKARRAIRNSKNEEQ